MAGQKRTRTGDPKPPSNPQPHEQDTPMTDTPLCGQAQRTSTMMPTATRTKPTPQNPPQPDLKPSQKATTPSTTKPTTTSNQPTTKQPPKSRSRQRVRGVGGGGIQKRPLLPSNTTLSKRPLLHPALPSPFSSAENPKVLYITTTTAFVPACKRVRGLLTQISKREGQSASEAKRRGKQGGQGKRGLEANGHLKPGDVEARIASTAAAVRGRGGKGGASRGEEVYLKATGRAIPRALELGVKFQGEEGCCVRVEMGSVKAIDDVVVTASGSGGGERKGVEAGEGKEEEEEEIPETRIRTLSTVTVCIGLS